jgi:hypothetical protein
VNSEAFSKKRKEAKELYRKKKEIMDGKKSRGDRTSK